MRRAIRRTVSLLDECFGPTGPVVELGSYYVPGYQWLGDLRPYFPSREFIGCDIRPGPGVDRLEDAQRLTFPDRSVGTLLSFEVLEHVPHPEQALGEIRRVLRPDGIFAMSVPFTFRLHGLPHDYRRLTASGVHVWLEGFGDKVVFALGPRVKPAFVFAVATPVASPAFSEAKHIFERRVIETFHATRFRGWVSTMKERGRDFLGCLFGRAELQAAFHRPGRADGKGG